MFGSGVQARLRRLDIYRKLPSDLTEPTMAGALISLISTVIIGLLFFTELQVRNTQLLNMQNNLNSEMFVDINRGGEQMRINLDIVFNKFPCDIVSVDVMDIMGSHTVNLGGELLKRRLKDGQVLSEEVHQQQEVHQDHSHPKVDMNRIQEAFKNKEGCQLVGHIIINKVPGNFHISSHAYGHILNQVFHSVGIQTIDLSHKINHISFGDETDLTQIKKQFNKGILNPLDGTFRQKNKDEEHVGISYNYYLSVVPTTYADVKGKEYYVHQFTVNDNELETHHLPAVYFRYDLSPVTVRFSQYRENFLHFLVQICAIIGGVFTVAGIIDSLVHKSIVNILKKHEQGKLI